MTTVSTSPVLLGYPLRLKDFRYGTWCLRRNPAESCSYNGYGTEPTLAWMMEEKDIKPHVPVWDKTERKNDSFYEQRFPLE